MGMPEECPRCGRDCLEMQLEVTAAEAERNEKNNKEIAAVIAQWLARTLPSKE